MRSLKVICWLQTVVLASLPLAAQPPEQPGFAEKITELLNQGDYSLALTTIFDALAANPEDQVARDALMMVFETGVTQGQTAVLEESFREWARREPQNPLAHCWLGAALAAQPDQGDEAEEEYQQALELDPQCADAHFRLAALWQRQGQEAEAQAEWRKFLELEPDSDRAWLVRHGLVVIGSRNVTNTPQTPPEYHPAWSPDGKYLAFAQGWDWNIWRLDLVTGERTALTGSGKNEESLDWSPDGRLILFTKRDDTAKTKHLYTVPADGSLAEQRLCEVSPAQVTRWSPDGQKVYFTGPDGLWVVGSDGREATPLPNREGLRIYHGWPSPSPDGKWIACAAPLGAGQRDVCIFPLEDPARHLHLIETHCQHQYPTFSPDGRYVLFASNEKGRFNVNVAAVDEPGREVIIFLCDFDFQWGPQPRWSPDGRKIVVTRPRFGDIWVATLGGLDTRPLKMAAAPQEGGLLVSLTNRSGEPQTVNLTYRLFDEDSVQVAEGAAGKPGLALQPGEVIECPLTLDAATEPGTYTVKLTAVTEKGARVVELVDYEAK